MKIIFETGFDDISRYILVVIRIGRFRFNVAFDNVCQYVDCGYVENTWILKKLWKRTENLKAVNDYLLNQIKYQLVINKSGNVYIDTNRASYATADWKNIAKQFKTFESEELSNYIRIRATV